MNNFEKIEGYKKFGQGNKPFKKYSRACKYCYNDFKTELKHGKVCYNCKIINLEEKVNKLKIMWKNKK